MHIRVYTLYQLGVFGVSQRVQLECRHGNWAHTCGGWATHFHSGTLTGPPEFAAAVGNLELVGPVLTLTSSMNLGSHLKPVFVLCHTARGGGVVGCRALGFNLCRGVSLMAQHEEETGHAQQHISLCPLVRPDDVRNSVAADMRNTQRSPRNGG